MHGKVFDMGVCIFLFRLIDPQTQVTRLRVRWSLFLCLDSFRLRHVSNDLSDLFPPPRSSRSSLSPVWFSVRPIRTTRGCLVSFCTRRAGGAMAEPSATSSSPTTMERRSSACSSVRLAVRHSVCLTCLSSSCVSDLRQHRSGQADSLPLWDGESDGKLHYAEANWPSGAVLEVNYLIRLVVFVV